MRVRKRSNRQEVVARVVAKQAVAGGLFQKGRASMSPPHAHTTGGKRGGSLRRARSSIPLPSLGTCTEQWRFTGPTEKSNQRKTECHQSALLGLHSCG